MRLINSKTFEMEEFFGSAIPKYAILSHRWADGEVSLNEMTHLTPEVKSKKGFKKIALTCEQAVKDNLEWAWVDTCCIDKTSSSELSEAINSMFQWYEESSVCYAYLIDVPAVTVYVQGGSYQPQWKTITRPDLEAFPKSTWLTRGWTLQELIAPKEVVFYGEDWLHLGTRSDLSILLTSSTRIPKDVLDYQYWVTLPSNPNPSDKYSVAQKMSWAANRECTRLEDVAYCMLGLFGINMPLLYGEGEHAFTRLQEEIFKSTDDHSLLAWSVPRSSRHATPPIWTLTSVLAWSPACFESCEHVVSLHEEPAEPSTMTKKGIRAYIPIEDESDLAAWNLPRKYTLARTCRAVLNSAKNTGEHLLDQRICLLLVKNDASNKAVSSYWPKSYSRLLTPGHLFVTSERFKSKEPIPDPDNDIYRTIFLRLHPRDFRGSDFIRPIANEPINFYIEGLPWALMSDFSQPMAPPHHMSPDRTFGYIIAHRSYFTFEGMYSNKIRRLGTSKNKLMPDYLLATLGWNTTNARGIPCFSSTGHIMFRVNVANSLGREGFSVICKISRPQRNTCGSFEMELRPDQGTGGLSQVSGFANIEDINGSVADLDVVLGDVIVSVELLATQSWSHPRGTAPDLPGQLLHVLLRISFRLASPQGSRASRVLQRWRINTQEPWSKPIHVLDLEDLKTQEALENAKRIVEKEERSRGLRPGLSYSPWSS